MPVWLVALSLLASDTVATPRAVDPWFGPDKVKHAVVAFAVQGGSYATLRTVSGHGTAMVGATIAAAGVSLLKERFDRRRTGFSMRDLAWDALGIAIASVVVSHAPQR